MPFLEKKTFHFMSLMTTLLFSYFLLLILGCLYHLLVSSLCYVVFISLCSHPTYQSPDIKDLLRPETFLMPAQIPCSSG